MKASFLVSIFGALWSPLYVIATEDNHSPTSGAVVAQPRALSPPPGDAAIPGKVARALFTTDVINREPVDTVSTLNNDKTTITYFTEIQDMAGQTVIHRWEYQDKVLVEVRFEVDAANWRIYSTKTLDPRWLGEWKASVVDAVGGSLSVNTFTYADKSGKPVQTGEGPKTKSSVNKRTR